MEDWRIDTTPCPGPWSITPLEDALEGMLGSLAVSFESTSPFMESFRKQQALYQEAMGNIQRVSIKLGPEVHYISPFGIFDEGLKRIDDLAKEVLARKQLRNTGPKKPPTWQQRKRR